MSKKTRHKNLAASAQKRHEERRRRQKRKQMTVGIVVGFVVVLAVGFLLFPILAESDDAASDTPSQPQGQTMPEGFPRTEPFPITLEDGGSYSATMKTSEGPIQLELFPKESPETVNNFVNLADEGYFDGMVFHRIAKSIDIIQGGDPNCTSGETPEICGNGGPGYEIPDELDNGLKLEIGSIAMANAGPDTGGSQFFIVTGPKALELPPAYTIFGKITEGLENAQAIQDAPTTPDDHPTEKISIDSVKIEGP